MKSVIISSLLICSIAFGQDSLKNLRGIVTDLNKNLLKGVIIILKNENKFELKEKDSEESKDSIVPGMILSPLDLYAGGETNIYGDYNFMVSLGEHILEISYPGFKTVIDTIIVTKVSWDVYNYQLEEEFLDSNLIVNVPHKYLDNNYIEPGEEFRYGFSINNIYLSDLGRFDFNCRFLYRRDSSYTFQIDSLKEKYPKLYEHAYFSICIRFESGLFNLSEDQKLKFISELNEGIITFHIYSHSMQIPFRTNETYNVEGESHIWFQSSFGLFIKKDSVYLFAGVADSYLNAGINLPEDFPMTVDWEKVLMANYLISDFFVYYNMLYSYKLGNETILLNQNESGNIGDYIIYQGIARLQELSEPNQVVCDGGVNGISFVIIKK